MNLIRLVFNMVWLMEDFKDIKRRTASDKTLKDKAFNIAKDPKYDGYQRGLASMVYTNQLLKKLRKQKFILDLKIIFGVLI